MLAAPPSWRQVTSRISSRASRARRARRCSSRPARRTRVDAVDAQLVDQDLAAAPAHSARPARGTRLPAASSAARRRPDPRSGSSASPPTPREQQDAHECRLARLRGGGEDRVGPGLEPRFQRPVLVSVPFRVDPDRSVEEAANPRPRMRVPVRHPARREIDAVAAQQPRNGGIELDLGREQRAGRPSSWSSQTSARPVDGAAPAWASSRSRS